MKGKLLLTGFEPFGQDKVNPSGDVARSLDGADIEGYQVVSRILPVEWGTAKERIESYIDEVSPKVVLSLGLAAGRAEISVEKVAVNYTSKTKDNAGVIPMDRAIVEGASDAYFATIPVERIAEEICKIGIPARLSLTAGAYLCNYVFFCASRHVREKGGDARVGFIHVPATPKMVACQTAAGRSHGCPSMDESLIKAAVERALRTTVDSLTNCG